MAEERPMIEFRDVSIRLGGKDILDHMSFKVKRGEIFTIIGYSGTGKSVTLQNMTGLLIPDRGTIYVDGAQIVGMEEGELEETRRKFGYLFQSGALINWLTVGENVELPLREHTSLSRKARKQIVQDKLKLVSMEGDGDKYPDEISGGMKKRAALARAIALEPEIVLFDEPTSGLDPVISRQIDELIKAINRVMKITCIVVTHDMESAYGISDRIAFFYKGRVHLAATPREFRLAPDEALRHFVSGGKEGRLTQKSMTAIIRSQPLLDKDEQPSDQSAEPIASNVEAKLRKTVKETRRLTKEDLKQRRGAGRSSVLESVPDPKEDQGDGNATQHAQATESPQPAAAHGRESSRDLPDPKRPVVQGETSMDSAEATIEENHTPTPGEMTLELDDEEKSYVNPSETNTVRISGEELSSRRAIATSESANSLETNSHAKTPSGNIKRIDPADAADDHNESTKETPSASSKDAEKESSA